MNKWWKQCRLELKLLFQNKFFLVLPLLYGVWMTYFLVKVPPYRADHLLINVDDFNKLAHTMSLGIVMLIGMLMIRRDILTPSFEWLQSWPRSLALTIVAKIFSAMMYFTSFTLVMTIVYVSVASIRHQLSFTEYYVYLLEDIFRYQVSYFVTLALAMFLATVIRHRFVYLIGFCAWMFGTFFIDIFMIERLQLHFLHTFHLSQYRLSSLLANEVWGIHLFWQQIWLSRIFVIGFAVMLVTIMIMLLNNRRATSLQRKWNWYGVSSAILAILLIVPYTIDYLKTASAFAVIYEDAYLVGEEYYAARDSFYDFVVEAYEIEVERKEDNSLVIEANLFIDQEQLEGLREVSFRINPLLEVNQVSLNERIVPFSQDGSLVTLEELVLIDGLQRVQFSYEGKMNLVGLRAFDYSGVSLFSFVDGDALFLDSDIGWYPIPGNIPLFTDFGNRQVHLRGQERTPQLASFHLTLTNFNDVYGTIATIDRQKGSQVLFSKATSGVSLFGGNFVEISANDRMVVTNSFNKSEATRLLTDMEKLADYFGEMLEDVLPLEGDLLVIPNDGLGFYQYGVAMKDNSIVIPMSYLNRFVNKESVHDYSFIREITYYHLFREFHFSHSFYGESLAPALEHSFYFLYLKDGLQLDNDEFKRAAGHAPYHFYTSEIVQYDYNEDWGWTREDYERQIEMERNSHRAGRMVLDALEEGKIDEVKQFLVEMYETYVIPQQGQQYVYQPEITIENWDDMWNKVMQNE